MIAVTQTGHSDPLSFGVVVGDSDSQTRHQVTMSKADYGRLTNGTCPPEQLVDAAFRFLLEREPKEAILSRFDISVISQYFPDFETKLPQYMASDSPR
jgi:hypothetical protein